MKRKKVLLLITKSNWGGAQRYVYDVATSLPKDRFEVVVALGGNGPLLEHLNQANIRTISIPGLQRNISLSKELRSFREIWKIIGKETPDVLHVNSSKAGGLGALIGRLRSVPKVVYSAHGWAFNENRGFLYKTIVGFFHWLTVMFAHVTIAVSNAVKHQMQWPFAQRKIIVVQNGRELPAFIEKDAARTACIEVAPALAEYRGTIWTGTIAELHPVKRHDLAIEAIAQLVADGHTIRHLIIGDGQEKESLQNLITRKGLEEHVFLLGHIHEASTLLPALDIFIPPSRSEAFGYTVIEAAQAGLPIIAANVGGIPEIITDGWDGILFVREDIDELTDALTMLLRDPIQRDKLARAAQTRGQHFSLERMVVDTTAVYNR